jgi:hypothetical protein
MKILTVHCAIMYAKNIDVYVTQHLCSMSQMTDKKAGYNVSRRFAHNVCVKK